jgi:hypothetical protein
MARLVTASTPTSRRGSAPTAESVRNRPHRKLPASRRHDQRTVCSVSAMPVPERREQPAPDVELLGAYTDAIGRRREVIAARRGDGCVLVIDRDELTLGDRQLVAHIGAEEPASNAALMFALYVTDGNRGRCRRVRPDDLIDLSVGARRKAEQSRSRSSHTRELLARAGEGEQDHIYSLEPVQADRAVSELRWQVRPRAHPVATLRSVSLRQVVAAIESYTPVFECTLAALADHEDDPKVSGTALRQELERLQESPVVLNRGLREAVRAAVERGVSMGEIALRCNRVKRDGHGNSSGQTSWLARRIGLAPESGGSRPTPWIHSEVLALIAREGLGIGPHEVEL